MVNKKGKQMLWSMEGSSKSKSVSLISTSNDQELSISSQTAHNNFDAEPLTQINNSLTPNRVI